MFRTIAGLLVGVVIGCAVTLGVVVITGAEYEYRNISSFSRDEIQQMYTKGTSCMPIGWGSETQQVWFRCSRVRLIP